MNNYLVVLSAVFLLSGYAFAQEAKPVNMPVKSPAVEAKPASLLKDCVIMKDGKMMMIKDGVTMMMPDDLVMPNGTKVMKDGTCVLNAGTRIIMLKEGDRVYMNGKMTKHIRTAKK